MLSLGREYGDFPKFAAPQALLNSSSQGIPALLLMNFFGPAVAGYYAVSVRLIQSPMNLILTPVRQVFLQKTSRHYNLKRDLLPQFRTMTLMLLMIIALPAAMLFSVRPGALQLVSWRGVGRSGCLCGLVGPLAGGNVCQRPGHGHRSSPSTAEAVVHL